MKKGEQFEHPEALSRVLAAVSALDDVQKEKVLHAATYRGILDAASAGDTVVFEDGTTGVLTRIYWNGPGYFIRWSVPGKAYSESDSWCCDPCRNPTGRSGVLPAPSDIIAVVPPRGCVTLIVRPLLDDGPSDN